MLFLKICLMVITAIFTPMSESEHRAHYTDLINEQYVAQWDKYKSPIAERILIKTVVDDIKRHEGFSPTRYRDGNGWSIGYGSRNRGIKNITEEQATFLVFDDINYIVERFDMNIPWWREAPVDCQRAMINMAYNLGITGFLQFKNAIAYMEAGEYSKAALEVLYKNGDNPTAKTNYWKKVGSRAVEVASLIENSATV